MSIYSKVSTFILTGFFSASAVAATELNLPHTPLSVSTSRVEPNVMLVIDNSGSMRNIIWADGYNPDTNYPKWGNWDSASGNVTLRNMQRCYGGSYYARNSKGVEKCLYLPDPYGNRYTRYTGNYLNYLFTTYEHYTDLRKGEIPQDYRMEVAKEVAKSVIDSVEGVRFGISTFHTYHGGYVLEGCSDTTDAKIQRMKNRIDDSIAPNANTPIAETLYEVTRYFRGLSALWSDGYFNSPIAYRCQKNFSIIITDGEPTEDGFEGVDQSSFSADTVPGMSNRTPNWKENEGVVDGVNLDNFYLNDIARFARDVDMKQSGFDSAGKSFNDPSFPKQNMDTYTVGFALDHALLEQTARDGNGQYYTASNAEQLATALESALSDISDKVATTSSAAVSQGVLSVDTLAIIPEFNSRYWTGDLKAYRFDTDPTSPTYLQFKTAWQSASALLGTGTRHIITRNAGKGVPFRWDRLSNTQKGLLGNSGSDLVGFIRGDRSNEGTLFRKREGLLGDIVYSSPQYVGAPNFRYDNADYRRFREKYKDRKHVLYVGANDGMLHAFDAESGKELFGFIPQAVMGQLKELADKGYEHRFYVDGTPTILDAEINGKWRSVLVGGLNRGGQSIYALDVTDPTTFKESNAASMFLWEFADADLGYSFSRPAIVQLQDGTWAAVFGNGYNSTEADGQASTTGDAVLFIVDLATGKLLYKLSTGEGSKDDPLGDRPNGLATATPVDLNGDGRADFVYAGDLFGNLWRFDLKGLKKPSNNGKPVTNASSLVFVACSNNTNTCAAADRQPITSAPTVGRHPAGGVMVHFGTGKYLEPSDKTDVGSGLQSLYAIWDKPEATGKKTVSRKDLLAQRIIPASQIVKKTGQNYDVRVVSADTPDWSKHRGWYLDLDQPTSERIVRKPILRNGKIIYTSLLPVLDSSDPCVSESQSWLMELNATTGGALGYANFDLNGDGRFDEKDWVLDKSAGPGSPDGSGTERPSTGIKLDGEKPGPSIVPVDPEKEVKVLDKDTVILENPGPGMEGRLSWRELVN